MSTDIVLKYDTRVPRYTSYPTANHFHRGIGPEQHARWLAAIPADQAVSVYFHVPFCDILCWYCGCHTQVLHRKDQLAAYADLLRREIDLVADRLPARLSVAAMHWGGGTPTTLAAGDIDAAFEQVRRRFDLRPDAEIAVEVDARVFDPAMATMLAANGVNRISLGVQDFAPAVQQAINRLQSFERTAEVVAMLRGVGIDRFNIDLVYGLPRQTVDTLLATVDRALELGPSRFAVFGYAHVPWMQKRQRLIDEQELPGARERLRMFAAVTERLLAAGFRHLGLDHFARPDDELAVAQSEGRLRRNFQGYTADPATTLIGFGASAISALPDGFAQNAVPQLDYRRAIAEGRLATARGIALSPDDRLIAHVIERVMCDLRVDLDAVAARYQVPAGRFDGALEALRRFEADGLVERRGRLITVKESGRLLLRNVCSLFDSYLAPAAQAHARAI